LGDGVLFPDGKEPSVGPPNLGVAGTGAGLDIGGLKPALGIPGAYLAIGGGLDPGGR
jgi:hypothetical protein